MNKKAFIAHPVTLAIITFLVGFLIGVLVAKGIIPLGQYIPIIECPK